MWTVIRDNCKDLLCTYVHFVLHGSSWIKRFGKADKFIFFIGLNVLMATFLLGPMQKKSWNGLDLTLILNCDTGKK